MYHFEYVSKKEAAPYKAELIEILHQVQDYELNTCTVFGLRWYVYPFVNILIV